MDPFSLALGVISVFKDGYLVARFLYNTINSGLKYAEERVEISQQLRRELLFLQSFGSWFLKCKGEVTSDAELNISWLQEIRSILENLRTDLAEYRLLAEKGDEQYRKYSPALNPPYQTSGLIEFDLTQPVAPVSEPTMLSQFGKMFSKSAVKDIYLAGEWALLRKRKLEKVIVRFEKRNNLLRNIIQIAIPSQIQAINVPASIPDRWLESQHPDRLGLRGHVQIAKITQTQDQGSDDLLIKNATLVCDQADPDETIHPGRLKVDKAKNNVQTERVLVEFKHYTLGNSDTTEDTNQTKARRGKQVSKLATLLHSSGSYSLGTLPLKGYIDQPDLNRYAFIFNYPEGTSTKHPPQTLHSLIDPGPDSEPSKPWPLAQRFHTAHKLASILGAFNNDGWVHKSIRSHSVAFCTSPSSTAILSKPYLINFEYSRLHYNTTTLDRDEDALRDLYRHPALQVSDRQDSFSAVHDIYALGVVLLEIALWKTAAQIVHEYPAQRPSSAAEVRRLYIKIARMEVPWLMGEAFLKAILACLTNEFEDDFVVTDRGTFRKRVVENLSPKALQVDESWS